MNASKKLRVMGLGIVALVATGCPSDGTSTKKCTAARDCDAAEASRGYLCLEGECIACESDGECRQVAYYGAATACREGRCTSTVPPCEAGADGCPCLEGGACNGGLVCDAASTRCRAAKSCTQAGCAAHQLCEEGASGQDARCLESCEPGFAWDPVAAACGATAATCVEGATGSIKAQCDAQHRACVADGAGAHCGDCQSGYEASGGECVVSDLCKPLDCAARHRLCEVSATTQTAACTRCEDGYVEDGAACRALATCASLGCAADRCIEVPGRDARCLAAGEDICAIGPICPEGQAWRRGTGGAKGQCVTCPPCPVGPASTGKVYPVAMLADGKCVCVPEAGYFFKVGGSLSNLPCDADGDGWVRGDARDTLHAEDCAIRANGRCDVRTIDRFLLEGDEPGDALAVVLVADDPVLSVLPVVQELGGVLELYEADVNDDLTLRAAAGLDPLAPYDPAGLGTTTRALRAEELDSLTKACMGAPRGAASVDYNGNGIADVEEWHGMPPRALEEWLEPFTHFAYYLELYEGYYIASPVTGAPGAYFIAEKSRQSPPAGVQSVPLVTSDGSGTAQICHRRTDSDYVANATVAAPSIGMDFARWSRQTASYGVPSLTHGSQYKCLQIVPDSTTLDESQRRAIPHVLRQREVGPLYDVNGCTVNVSAPKQGSVPLGSIQGGTTWSPMLQCQRLGTTPAGVTTLAVARYQNYSVSGQYERGCINACVDQAYLPPAERCEGWGLGQSSCTWDATTGRRTGCFYNAGCADCSWTEAGWVCTPRTATVCGACGTCRSVSNDPLRPSWQCFANHSACQGTCEGCEESATTPGIFVCVPRESLCAGECKRCQWSETRYDCANVDSDCPATSWEPWGNCTYKSTCAPDGSRTRTGTDYVCTNGSCYPKAVTETETAPCDRSTEDTTCGPTSVSTSDCDYSDDCDERANQTVTTTRNTCANGACATTVSSETRTCTRNTDKVVCGSEVCGDDDSGRIDRCCSNGSCSRTCGRCTF